MSKGAPRVKLKLNTSTASAGPAADSTSTPGGGIKLSFNKSASNVTPASLTKKRAHEDDEPPSTANKAKFPVIRLKSQNATPTRKGSIIKLKRSNGTPTTPGIRPSLKIKHKGRVPQRPLGVGYDSECSDAEEDPAIEENFILRMTPGPDADYIRKAIEEKRVGVPVRDGGADLGFRFFTRDGRKACVRVQDRFYSAVLVDLPCIIESMKSWDKKGWWKAADVCQMLLVTGRVETEDAARNVPLPAEVDATTWAFPHGLTPPMWDVRRRRFRKRASNRRIEQAEEEVERLLAEDERSKERGGSTKVELLTWEELRRQEEGEGTDELQDDAEGDFEEDADDVDEDQFMADFQAALGEDDDDDETSTMATPVAGVLATDALVPATEGNEGILIAEAGSDSAGSDRVRDVREQSGSGSDEDDDDDNDDEDDEEISEEARERRERAAQQREEIAHLERQIADKKRQLATTTNPLLRTRVLNTIQKFEEDRDVKRRGLGLTSDDDGEDD